MCSIHIQSNASVTGYSCFLNKPLNFCYIYKSGPYMFVCSKKINGLFMALSKFLHCGFRLSQIQKLSEWCLGQLLLTLYALLLAKMFLYVFFTLGVWISLNPCMYLCSLLAQSAISLYFLVSACNLKYRCACLGNWSPRLP